MNVTHWFNHTLDIEEERISDVEYRLGGGNNPE